MGEGDDCGAAGDRDVDGGAEGEGVDDDEDGDVGFEGAEPVEAPFGEDERLGWGLGHEAPWWLELVFVISKNGRMNELSDFGV